MIKVYVAGPYSANNVIDVLKNIGRGEKVCAELFKFGFAPFCPWHDKSYVTDNCDIDLDVKQFYDYSIEWLSVSDCMIVIDIVSSKGTMNEIQFAKDNNIPIFFSIKKLLNYYK